MVKRNLVANYLGQGWSAIMNFAFIPIYINHLGIESYGLIGLFGILQAWLSLLDMGMTPSISREMARFKGGEHTAVSIRSLLRSIEVIAIIAALLIIFGVWFSSSWLAANWLRADKLPVSTVSSAFNIMGLVTALRFLEGIYKSAIVGLQKQVLLNVLNIVFSSLRGIGAIAILVWVSPSIHYFFLWQGFVSLFALAVFAYWTYENLPRTDQFIRFSFASLLPIKKYAGGIIGITILTLTLTQIDKIFLSRLISLSDFGYYSLATIVASSLFPIIGPIIQVWFPKLTELQSANEHELLATKFHQGAQLVSVFMGSAAVMMIFYADSILQLWTQNPTLAFNSAQLLRLAALTCLLNGLNYIPYNTQLAFGWTGLTIRINAISIFIIVPLVYFLSTHFGAIGALSASIILNLGQLIIGTQFMFRKILQSERGKWYFEDLLIPIVTACCIAFSFTWIIPANLSSIAQLIWLLIVGFFVMTGTIYSAFHVRHSALYLVRYIFRGMK